jgi:hypothetical protein
MRLSRKLSGIVVGLCLTSVVSAYAADPVTHWHTIATTAINAGRPAPPGLFDYALVQVAVHDAVQVIEGKYQPYHYSDPSMLGQGSTAAAVAAATHRMLVLLYGVKPALEADYAAYILALDPTGTDPAVAIGVDIGEAAAEAIHPAHYKPLIGVTPFFGNDGVGQWRSAVPLGLHFMAVSTPFTLNRVDQFRPQPPPPLTSMIYARDYAEVQSVGSGADHLDPTNPNTILAVLGGEFPDAVERGRAGHRRQPPRDRRRSGAATGIGESCRRRRSDGRVGLESVLQLLATRHGDRRGRV